MQGQIWITDFGLAKVQDSDELTRTGDVVGTLKYMAPERFTGWSDPRSDVYALGTTLYEMLTLRPAFEESDRVKLIERVLHHSPPPIRQLDRRIPRDLETIVSQGAGEGAGRSLPVGRTTWPRTCVDSSRAGRSWPAGRAAIERSGAGASETRYWPRATGAVAAALLSVAVISVIYASEQAKANGENRKLADKLTKSLAESNRLLAIRNFDRGQAAFEKDQIGAGPALDDRELAVGGRRR